MGHNDKYRRILSRMGYYDYQQGLIFRYLSQNMRWESHLSQCRCFILDSILPDPPEKITVLGSGWLLDLPLAELVELVGSITLIDIVHPPEVREQTAKYPNIDLVEADLLAGLIESVWNITRGNWLKQRLDLVEKIIVPQYELDKPGMVISLNILTQLEILPVRLLEKRTCLKESDYLELRKGIQMSHIKMLKNHSSLLISDVKETYTYSDGRTKEEPTLETELPESITEKRWKWDFDQTGQDFRNKRSVMEVVAMTF